MSNTPAPVIKRTIRFNLLPNPEGYRVVNVDLELRELLNKGKEFSASAMVWGRSRRDWEMGGQCLDKIEPSETDNPGLYSEIVALWKRWHLNGMRPGCEHQRSQEWDKLKLDESKPLTQQNMATWVRESEHPKGLLCKPCPVCGYEYGSKWLFEEIDETDLHRIEEIITANEGGQSA